MNEPVCENYEITIGEDGAGAVLTLDLDDLNAMEAIKPHLPLMHVRELRIDAEGFHIGFSDSEDTSGSLVFVLCPLQPGMEEIVTTLREHFGRMYVAVLGDGDEPGSSKIMFAREMLLA